MRAWPSVGLYGVCSIPAPSLGGLCQGAREQSATLFPYGTRCPSRCPFSMPANHAGVDRSHPHNPSSLTREAPGESPGWSEAQGLANGPGGAYLSTVRQGWKCSIPCKFPDSLLRVKHAEQNVMRRALPLTDRNGCTPLPPREALEALSVYYTLCV